MYRVLRSSNGGFKTLENKKFSLPSDADQAKLPPLIGSLSSLETGFNPRSYMEFSTFQVIEPELATSFLNTLSSLSLRASDISLMAYSI